MANEFSTAHHFRGALAGRPRLVYLSDAQATAASILSSAVGNMRCVLRVHGQNPADAGAGESEPTESPANVAMWRLTPFDSPNFLAGMSATLAELAERLAALSVGTNYSMLYQQELHAAEGSADARAVPAHSIVLTAYKNLVVQLSAVAL